VSNTMTVVGNLTGEPELRFTANGAAMLTGSIADNRRYQVNGEWQEETSYINFIAWRELAENAAASLTKGARVVITGRLQQRDWTDKDGNTRKSYDLVVDEIAPSLRWATATVTKTVKSDGSPKPAAQASAPAEYIEEDPF
jgi:single-strand DNA-binding protein